AAVNHLLDLGEKLDFANAAAPTLQIEAGPKLSALGIMIADAGGNLAHFLDDAEVERAAPDERLDRLQKMLASRSIARASASADERGPLPRQSARFVMRDGGIHGQDDGGD